MPAAVLPAGIVREMSGTDVLILVWVLLSIARGYRTGFLRQAFSIVGFLLGLLAGSWLAPFAAASVHGSVNRLVLGILMTLGLALVCANTAETAARRLQGATRIKHVDYFNKGLGVVFSVMAVLVSSWLIASALDRLPIASLGVSLQRSRIIRTMDTIMPPAPSIMERLGRIFSPHGFPQVFVGDEPYIDPSGPAVTPEVEAAAAKALASTVRIEGNGCGGISVGSGFVAAPGYVVTNAHVVAGIRRPVVLDRNGHHAATVVWFDPSVDFAVLKTDDLAGPPLPLATERALRGTTAAVLGYPGGGRLTIDPAVILASRAAVGRDIYNRGISTREIYAVQVDIDQGNSGGPVVLPDGSVAGVIFGEAVSRDDLGYALTSQQVAEDLREAITSSTSVNTGPCIAG